MPKRISAKDTKTIYYALKIGEIDGISQYTGVIPLDCQFTTHSGVKSVYSYGTLLNYNAIAIVEFNEKTWFINEFTKFWVNNKPDDSSEVAEYVVRSIGQPNNGLFKIFLSSETQNAHNIWYVHKGKIIMADVKFDKDELSVIVPKNALLPIWYDTKVWYREPSDAETAEYGMHMTYKEETEYYTKYYFEEGVYEDG